MSKLVLNASQVPSYESKKEVQWNIDDLIVNYNRDTKKLTGELFYIDENDKEHQTLLTLEETKQEVIKHEFYTFYPYPKKFSETKEFKEA